MEFFGRDVFMRRYAGGFLLLCMVLGGGTLSGLSSDFLLHLAALPIIFFAFTNREARFDRAVSALVFAILAVQLVQFAPRIWDGADFTAVTRDIGRSLDILVFTTVLAAFFFALSKLPQVEKLIPYLILGLAINVALAFVQFSSSRTLNWGLMPFELRGGLYTNENHFSALLFLCIPVVIAFFWERGWLLVGLGCVVVLIFLEFVAGSTAGILLSVACAAVTIWVLRERRGAGTYLVLAGAVVLALLALNLGRIVDTELARGIGFTSARHTYAVNTLEAIVAFLPFGSGLGTFPIIYPQFEPVAQIDATYVNHAHNEYLELLMEGGLLTAALMVAYFGLLVAGYGDARRSKLKMSALCGIVFVLIHSLVDYPLRTMGVASVFVFLNALYFVPHSPAGEGASRGHYLARRSPNLADAS